tara:strand:+ start:1424 stop:1657 length:234 start_codon:yes stop_codon:yes gene_type:complete
MPTSKTTNSSPRLKRAPTGCNAKAAYISLFPAERADLDRLAALNHYTDSAMGRVFLIEGMEAFNKRHPDGLLPENET